MKKILVSAAICAMLASGCQNEHIVDEQNRNFFCLEVQKGESSRTALKGDGTVVWSAGDKLYVYGDNGSEGTLMIDRDDVGKTQGTFTGFVKGDVKDLKYVVYGDMIKDGLNKIIRLSDFEYPNSNSPMFGEIETNVNNVNLMHLCSMIRINIIGLKAGDKVSIIGDGISGNGKLDETNETLTATEDTEKTITVTNAEVGTAIDIPVFAGSTITKVKVNDLTCTLTNPIQAVKNKLISLPVLNRTDAQLTDVENSGGTSSGEQEEVNIVETVDELKAAINNAESGEVIYLKDGIYDGAFYVNSKSVTLKGINKHQAVIGGKFAIASSDIVKFENLAFKVSDYTTKNNNVSHNVIDNSNNAIMMIYCADVELNGCAFTEMNDKVYAVRVRNNTASATAENEEMLTVKDCLFDGVRGIRSFSHVTVEGCTFEGMKYSCVDVLGLSKESKSCVKFVDNTSEENVPGIQLKDGNGYYKNVEFNVGGNLNCNTITYDGSKMNNLYFDTFKYTGEVKTMSKN